MHLNANGIRHSWNHHGKGHERTENNIPLSREDYDRYIDTLDAPTRITKGNASNRGEFTVRYIKDYPDGTMYIVELLAGENKTLQTKTMWKKQPLGGGGSVKNNSSHTSRTCTNAAVSSTDDSIAQEKEKGQQLGGKRQIQQRAKKTGPPVRRSRLSIFVSFAPIRRIFWE